MKKCFTEEQIIVRVEQIHQSLLNVLDEATSYCP